RNDFARPTVHARNLLHTSVAMYDIWAAYDNQANPYFLGNTVGNYTFDFEGLPMPDDVATARATAISYAAYRILYHRFSRSPGVEDSYPVFNELFEELGHDSSFVSTDYTSGNPAAFGNYVAEQVIAFGMQDNSNEIEDYANTYYNPFNYTLNPAIPGSGILFDPNRWQPLTFDVFIDQSGNLIPGGAPEFLSPEWGRVTPFALTPKELTIYERDFGEYWVYHDPGTPSYIDANGGLDTEDYQWGFALVSIWSSHLDPSDGVLWDISPGSIGNIDSLPKTMEGLREFYDLIEGGDPSRGHAINPHTGQPYEENIVPRADYARVLAEFWADGPDSETPPGHWFSILNYVNDHPLFEKRFRGEGPILDDLEWDVKAYLTLGGAVHDAAISAWGIKGWYDYIRPISAIRSMAGRGQSSDPNLPNYSISGLPLIDGFVEMVEAGDSLAGINNEHVGKVKVYAWRGPDYIEDEETDLAGVGWILAENWWPYQRPTFVTPPFAGYVSGHSTFSRAAAEVMTLLTGDAFFPGGMGVFECKKNEFLVFEEGPSVDLTLQWATYRDASDQTSLSRIWGGIHPPVDDVPGRVIGEKIGVAAFQHAKKYFDGLSTSIDELDEASDIHVFPNPIQAGQALNLYLSLDTGLQQVEIIDSYGKVVRSAQPINGTNTTLHHLDLPAGIYWLKLMGSRGVATKKFMVQQKD
ncbi:MAG: T9SS type A sorting domain-containing protein, partial [Bacteroidota bacterium]